MENKQHYILNERWRPSTLEGYICDDNLREKIKGWIEKQEIPMLGFFGKAGSGKTTLAKILAKNIDCDYLYLNAADKRSMDDIRNEILPFISSISFKSAPKIVILDEVTHTLAASQVLLLNIIETYSSNARFILTGNYPERLIDPLRSRLEEYNIVPPSKKIIAQHLDKLLTESSIQYELKDLGTIINTYYPDIRRTINNCQKHIVDNKLSIPENLKSNVNFENELINLMSKSTKNTFNQIRQLIVDYDISDFDGVYVKLFNQSKNFCPGMEGAIAIIVNEHMFQSNSVLDKEICFMACIAKILDVIKK
jgi:replication factor C small subunit